MFKKNHLALDDKCNDMKKSYGLCSCVEESRFSKEVGISRTECLQRVELHYSSRKVRGRLYACLCVRALAPTQSTNACMQTPLPFRAPSVCGSSTHQH